MGSTAPGTDEQQSGSQQLVPSPAVTRRAAFPYLSFTTSLMSDTVLAETTSVRFWSSFALTESAMLAAGEQQLGPQQLAPSPALTGTSLMFDMFRLLGPASAFLAEPGNGFGFDRFAARAALRVQERE